jgi:hypothetical protein
LGTQSLLAIVIELNPLSRDFGLDSSRALDELQEHGFRPISYDPFARRVLAHARTRASGNVVLVRSMDEVCDRIAKAARFSTLGTDV